MLFPWILGQLCFTPTTPHLFPLLDRPRFTNNHLTAPILLPPFLPSLRPSSNSAAPLSWPVHQISFRVMLSCNPIPYSRALLYMTLSLSILCSLGVATSLPSQNITIEVPNGTTNHGEPNSFCTPATWVDIASFLLFNYFAHGATVISYPGEQAGDTFYAVVSAVIAPTFGVIRALNFIIRHPLLTAKNDLEVAARSGALCMLVRSSTWQPQKGDNIRNALIQDPGIEPSLRGCNTSHSDPGTKISPTYVQPYSYARPIKLTNVFFVPKHCRLVGLHAAVA